MKTMKMVTLVVELELRSIFKLWLNTTSSWSKIVLKYPSSIWSNQLGYTHFDETAESKHIQNVVGVGVWQA